MTRRLERPARTTAGIALLWTASFLAEVALPLMAKEPGIDAVESSAARVSGLVALAEGAGNQLACVAQSLGCQVCIRSARGMGSARLKRLGDAWPKRIILQLQLKGLERLALNNGAQTLEISVPSYPDAEPLVTRRVGQEEFPLEQDSPLWTRPQIVGDDPTIPLQNAHFELLIPPALLEESPEELQIHWIDFYR